MPLNAFEKETSSPPVNISAGSPDLQENLRRLDRLANLGLVAANAAHEIKNGLVAVTTFVELLAQKGEEPEMAELVRRELKRIDSLVTQMLRFSTPKAGAFAPLHIHEVLNHSLRLLEHQMSGHRIALKRDFFATPDTICGNESQLQQAFMNLLFNAIDAIGSDGELAITTKISTEQNEGRWLKIFIHDSGPGIAAENLPHLFEPFFTTKKNGTGLGLAICRRVIEEQRGTIEIQSESGRGTTFIISLPTE